MWREAAKIAALAAGLLAAGCASVSVKNGIPLGPAPAQVPRVIFVQPFEFDEGAILVDRDGRRLEEFEATLRREMMQNLVERLPQYVAPAEGIPSQAVVPHGDYWLVSGKFTRLNQGSRALRGTVGFGAGGTKMDVSVTVSEMSGEAPRSFLLIETTGGSNAAPGAIMGIIAWPMIASGAGGLLEGVSGDARRTAREVTSALADYVGKERLSRKKKKTPRTKYKGGLAYPWWSTGPPEEAR